MYRYAQMSVSTVIFGCSGPGLTAGERAFFRDCNPWGFILFSRNVETPAQVRHLCADLRESVGRDAPIFVDQEGGRVQRLKGPHWRQYPAAHIFGDLYQQDQDGALRATWLNYRLIAHDLREVGITANCTPIVDLPVHGADSVISDRAFSSRVPDTIRLAHAAMAGLTAGGIIPVTKHIPGHGRADVDSHFKLPVIYEHLEELENHDFKPFRALSYGPVAMTAHVLIYDVDPKNPVTISKACVHNIIRRKIGFDGLLISDDLDMKALSGNLVQLAEHSLAAGCDIVLQCNGKMTSMVEVAQGLKPLSGNSARRASLAEYMTDHMESFDVHKAIVEYQTLMGKKQGFGEYEKVFA